MFLKVKEEARGRGLCLKKEQAFQTSFSDTCCSHWPDLSQGVPWLKGSLGNVVHQLVRTNSGFPFVRKGKRILFRWLTESTSPGQQDST